MLILIYRSIVLAHGHKLDEKNIPALNDGDILLCGHTHVPKCEKRWIYIYEPRFSIYP